MTAVEWLLQELKEYSTTPAYAQGSFILTIPKEDMVNMINQAKEMQKTQIIKAYSEGVFSETEWRNSEQYYNETYGQE